MGIRIKKATIKSSGINNSEEKPVTIETVVKLGEVSERLAKVEDAIEKLTEILEKIDINVIETFEMTINLLERTEYLDDMLAKVNRQGGTLNQKISILTTEIETIKETTNKIVEENYE